MEERYERLRDRFIKQIEDIVRLKKDEVPSELIEERFKDFAITKDAFIESVGCKKEPDIMKGNTLVMGGIICTKEKTHKCLANMEEHKLSECPSLKRFKEPLSQETIKKVTGEQLRKLPTERK